MGYSIFPMDGDPRGIKVLKIMRIVFAIGAVICFGLAGLLWGDEKQINNPHLLFDQVDISVMDINSTVTFSCGGGEVTIGPNNEGEFDVKLYNCTPTEAAKSFFETMKIYFNVDWCKR